MRHLETALLTILLFAICAVSAHLVLDGLTGRGYERQVELGLQYSTQAEREENKVTLEALNRFAGKP